MIIGHALFIVRPSDKMRRKEEIHLISFQISFPFKRFLSNGKDFGIFFFIITNRNRRKFQCALNLISFFYTYFLFIYIYFKTEYTGSILSEVYITSYTNYYIFRFFICPQFYSMLCCKCRVRIFTIFPRIKKKENRKL